VSAVPGLGAEVRRHLAPQERYEALVADAFRRHGPRLVDLGYANTYDGPGPEVRAALASALEDDGDLSFQYTPYGGSTPTRRLIASHLARRFSLASNFRDVVLTPGAMAGLNLVFRALFAAGDECLVLTPCWLDYPVYLSHLGVRFRFVPLGPDKHFDFAALAAAIGPRTRGLIFSHPGCPTGVVFPDAELRRLAELLAAKEAEHGGPLWVIGDEVHRDVNWGGAEIHSVLEYHPRSLSIYSFGKSLFLQGQRIGYVAVSPRMPEREEMRTRLQQLVRIMGFCTPTNLMQRAVRRLIGHEPPLGLVLERQRAVRAALAGYGYRVCEGEATFFVYVESPVHDDFTFAGRLAERGVLVLPSSVFHEPGWFRISLTARTDAVEAGLPAFAGLA